MPKAGTAVDIAGALELLSYDPETGRFHWKVDRKSYGGGVKVGDVAGTLKDGYIQIIVNQKAWRAHRLAWAAQTGALPEDGQEIDHINGDRADNKWCNLRSVSRSQNNYNLGVSRKNVSGVKGVSWVAAQNKWLARLKVDGRIVHLGVYEDKNLAIAARKSGEAKYHGQYARAA